MKRSRLGLIVLGLTVVATAQAQTLYSGKAADQGVTFRSWGGGFIRETDELAPADPFSIRISSRNYYQGGLIRFSRPINFADAFQNKDNLLKLTIRFPHGGTQAASPTATPGRPGGRPGGDGGGDDGGGDQGAGLPPSGVPPVGIPGVPPGSFPPGGFRGGVPQNGPPGLGGQRGVPAATAAPATPSSVRLIVSTSDGLKSEAYIDVPVDQAKAGAWIAGAIPLQAISGFARTNKEIVSLLISADVPSTLYVREIAISKDESPIYADLSPTTDLNLAFGDEFTFLASGYGGATQLKYEWNFDAEHSKGVDAEGRSVKRRFRKAGDFVVQVTVSDIYGLKKPFSRSIKVTVNP